jgi:aminoglycoside phosphotransferase (APT) family kinase protein
VGERLDRANLEAFLHTHGYDGDIDVHQVPAGSSNLTYLITIGNKEFVLRRPPFGNTVRTAHDMRREFDVLSKLSPVYRPAPKPLLFCDDVSVLGSEFYLMERRRGLVIRGTVKEDDLRERVDSSIDLQRSIVRSFIQNLAHLHSLNYKHAGLADLGKPEGYCRRQVEGWTKRYFAAKTHEHSELEAAFEWLNANIPAEFGASLVHNDYKFDNVMLDPDDLTKITAVLDWEMVTVGDPLMDLGTTLGYWMSPDAGEDMLTTPFNPRVLMERASREELADMYAEASGRDLPDILFYYVFGTFKIAVIAQQIYARFARGSTSDARFANFDQFVCALGRIAANAIDRGII